MYTSSKPVRNCLPRSHHTCEYLYKGKNKYTSLQYLRQLDTLPVKATLVSLPSFTIWVKSSGKDFKNLLHFGTAQFFGKSQLFESMEVLPYTFNPIALRKAKTLLHSERPKLYTILAFLNAIGLITYLYIDPRALEFRISAV